MDKITARSHYESEYGHEILVDFDHNYEYNIIDPS